MQHKTGSILLFFLVLTELLSSTVWTEYVQMDYCRYLHFISGLLIFVVLVIKRKPGKSIKNSNSKWVPWLSLAIILFWLIPKMKVLFIAHAIDFHNADMLPVIKVMCERWISILPIYTIIPEIWSGVMPIYLPALYFPYVPAIVLEFDMRWIGIVFTLGPLVYVILNRKSTLISWSVFILIGLFFDFILHSRHEAFTLSEEGVVYGYYMLLAFFIYHRQFISIGLIATCCLLSRYSGVFFIVFFPVCLYMMNQKRELTKYVSVGVLCGLILITIGRAWSHLGHLFGLSTIYLQNINENPDKYQNVLNDGIGLMPLIGLDHAQTVYSIQIILLIFIAMVMSIMVKKYHHSFYYLAFLKLSLVVFYNLLILPYTYLMYTSVFVSFVLFFLYANHQRDEEKNLNHVSIY